MESRSTKSDQTNGPIAYKGFILTRNFVDGVWYISKGGHRIGSADSLERAKAAIDELDPC